MRMVCFFLLCGALRAATYCDEPKGVSAGLRRSREQWDLPLTGDARQAAQRKILTELVAQFPDDIQANRRYQNDAGIPRAELIAQYKKRLDAAPDSALSIYFYALSLDSKDSAEKTRLYQVALDKDPTMAWPHMALAYDYSFGANMDKAKATAQVDAFFAKCPTSYDFYTNRMLATVASPAVMKRGAAALRERVEAETDPDLFGIYEHLWMLEFKSLPPEEHPGLRARVARDVARIRKAAPVLPLAMLRVIHGGLKQTTDAAGAAAMAEEIVRAYPQSRDAMDFVMEKWRKENPAADTDAFRTALYKVSGEWIARWPSNAPARASRFDTAMRLHSLSNEEVRAAGEQLLEFLKSGDSIYGFQPWEHTLAEEYLRRGAYLDQVAGLASAGLAVVRKRTEEQGREQMPAALRQRMTSPLRAAEIATVDLLARVGKRAEAEGLAARLASLTADGPFETAMRWQAESRVAELAGRPLDAVVYMEQALGGGAEQVKERRRAEAKRLWLAAGGTEKTWALRRGTGVLEAKTESAWTKPEKAIGKWELKDIAGKKWVSGELAGKTVFVNVWATWCGPCRAEHPHFQKLYEKLKDRKDVAVISFNVDDQVGLVQSYLNEGKYTFPVLLADRLVRETLEAVSIPRNWLIDGTGVHQLEQVGFMESSDWIEKMMAGIEKVK
jgi:thiol-disulfide isomerase/thioredoxin